MSDARVWISGKKFGLEQALHRGRTISVRGSVRLGAGFGLGTELFSSPAGAWVIAAASGAVVEAAATFRRRGCVAVLLLSA